MSSMSRRASFDSLDTPVLGGSILDGRYDDLCDVQRDAVRRLGVPKFVEIRSSMKLRMPQLLPSRKLRHQELVQSLLGDDAMSTYRDERMEIDKSAIALRQLEVMADRAEKPTSDYVLEATLACPRSSCVRTRS